MDDAPLRRRTILADARKKPSSVVPFFWAAVAVPVLAIGGVPLFVAWLIPGVPPPGPFG